MNQLFTLIRVLEGAWEFSYPRYMCFVDFEKVYDCVPWDVLKGSQWEYGVSELDIYGQDLKVQVGV